MKNSPIVKEENANTTCNRGDATTKAVRLTRALELTAVAALTMGIMVVSPMPALIALGLLCWYCSAWWLLVLLAAWLYWDRHAPCRGGRRMWLHKWFPLWRYARSYFPVEVVVAEGACFSATENYIMDVHPHPCFPTAVATALFGGQVPDAFPVGVEFKIVTVHFFFRFPIIRELAMAIGAISNRECSLRHVLRPPARGKVVILYSGHGNEVGIMRTDAFNVCLKRNGFCRVALLEGCSLIPVLVLGENLSYKQPARLLAWLDRNLGIPMIIPIGRGLFQEYFGFLPHRQPHVIVIGAPIKVIKTESPTKDEICALHRKYVAALRDLYVEYSARYAWSNLPFVEKTC